MKGIFLLNMPLLEIKAKKTVCNHVSSVSLWSLYPLSLWKRVYLI